MSSSTYAMVPVALMASETRPFFVAPDGIRPLVCGYSAESQDDARDTLLGRYPTIDGTARMWIGEQPHADGRVETDQPIGRDGEIISGDWHPTSAYHSGGAPDVEEPPVMGWCQDCAAHREVQLGHSKCQRPPAGWEDAAFSLEDMGWEAS